MADFDKTFELLRGLEFSDRTDLLHKNKTEYDVTFYGIYRYYNQKWIGWEIVDEAMDIFRDIKNASEMLSYDHELIGYVKQHYLDNYWYKMYLDEVNSQKMADEMFIFAINNNIKNAVKFAQRIIDVKVDGIIGKQTIKALNSFDESEFDRLYDESEIRFYSRLVQHNFKKFGRYLLGWVNRAFSV